MGIVQIIDSLDLTLNNELKKLKSLTLKNLIHIKSYVGNFTFTLFKQFNKNIFLLVISICYRFVFQIMRQKKVIIVVVNGM